MTSKLKDADYLARLRAGMPTVGLGRPRALRFARNPEVIVEFQSFLGDRAWRPLGKSCSHEPRAKYRIRLANKQAELFERSPLKWTPAPARTEWGAGMIEALIELTPDHTARVFTEAGTEALIVSALLRLSERDSA